MFGIADQHSLLQVVLKDAFSGLNQNRRTLTISTRRKEKKTQPFVWFLRSSNDNIHQSGSFYCFHRHAITVSNVKVLKQKEKGTAIKMNNTATQRNHEMFIGKMSRESSQTKLTFCISRFTRKIISNKTLPRDRNPIATLLTLSRKSHAIGYSRSCFKQDKSNKRS